MEVSITRFRRELFDLVNQAIAGTEVWVTYKGQRFKIAPECVPASKLDRITPLDLINEDWTEEDERAMKEEMQREWEKDWSKL